MKKCTEHDINNNGFIKRGCNIYTSFDLSMLSAGPTGPTGPTGPIGPSGLIPNFEIGNVITGPPGTSAEVTIKEIN